MTDNNEDAGRQINIIPTQDLGKKKLERKNFSVELPVFTDQTKPYGFLDNDKACQALYYYYLLARKNYEQEIVDPIVLEGDPDPIFNYHNLFKSIAILYGVAPERMILFWPNVDMQCTLDKTPPMPKGDMYRFDKIPEIKTT